MRLTASLSFGRSTWTRDSHDVVFSARRALWRLDGQRGGTPERLPFVGQDGQSPVIARNLDGKQRLVYVRSVSDSNVWRLTTSAPATRLNCTDTGDCVYEGRIHSRRLA